MDQIAEDILESRYYEILNTKDNFYYKLACEYMARTELYDRMISDKKNPYDESKVYLYTPLQRYLSNVYAKTVMKEILHRHHEHDLPYIHKEIIKYSLYSDQMWIDEWNRLKESEE